jgi:hypothetical protein
MSFDVRVGQKSLGKVTELVGQNSLELTEAQEAARAIIRLANVTFAPSSTKRIIGNLVGTTPHWGGENSTFQGNAVFFTPSLMVLAPRIVFIQL